MMPPEMISDAAFPAFFAIVMLTALAICAWQIYLVQRRATIAAQNRRLDRAVRAYFDRKAVETAINDWRLERRLGGIR